MTARTFRLLSLKLNGFGHFVDYQARLKPGLNVLFGPNEAGKSTLMTFVRDVLFGFPRRPGERALKPVTGGGDFGGSLEIEVDGVRYEAQRLSRRGRIEGELQLFDQHGQVADARLLPQLLGGVGRTLFGQVFAFTLDELHDFEALAGEHDVSEALLVAALPGGNALPVANKALELELNAWGHRKHKSPLAVELQRLQQVREQLKQLGDLPRQYAEALEQKTQLDAEKLLLLERRAAVMHKLTRLQRLARALPELKSARQAKARLEQETAEPFALVDAAARAREVRHRLLAAEADVSQAHEALRQAQARRDGVPETRVDVGAADEAVEAFSRFRGAMETHPQRRAAWQQASAQLARRRAELGLPEGATVAVGPLREALARLQPGMQAARRDRDAAEARWQVAQAEAHAAKAEHERLAIASTEALTNASDVPVTLSGAEGGVEGRAVHLAAHLRSRLDALAQLPSLSAERDRLQHAAAVAPTAPRRLWPAVAAVVGAAVVMFAICALTVTLGIALAMFAVTLALGAAALWFGQRLVGPSRDAAAGERAAAAARLAQCESQLAAARAEAGVAAGANLAAAREQLTQRIEAALLAARLAGDATRAAQRVNDTAATFAAAERAVSSCDAALDALSLELSTVLGPLDDHCGGDPDRAAALLATLERVVADETQLTEQGTALSAEAQQLDDAARALATAASAAGVPADVEPLELWATLRRRATEARELQQRRQVATAQVDALVGPLEALSARVKTLHQQLQQLLAEAQVSDAASLESRGEHARRYAEAADALAEAMARAEASLGERPEPLDDWQRQALEAAELVDDTEVERHDVESQLETVHQSAGRLAERLERLKNDDQVAALKAQEASLQAALMPKLQRWAVAKVAEQSLERARKAVEQKNQPRVARYASEIFARLTGGRYTQVLPQADGVVQVREDGGRLWQPEQLSRGTRELLFIAFRLAVARGFGEDKVALPMLLDDVLVNFDPDRALALTTELAELARLGHQVLTFTCHPHLKTMLVNSGGHAVEVTTRSQLSLLG